MKSLNNRSADEADGYIKTSYYGGVKVAEKQLGDAGVTLRADMNRINEKVVGAYASQVSQRLADVVTVAGRTTEDIYGRLKLNTALTGTLAGYESIGETQRKMQKIAEGEGIVGFVDKAGHQWGMASYVEMLTRTTTMQLHNTAIKNEFMAHDEDLIIVSRHGTKCDLCGKWEGQVLSLTGDTKGYPTVDEAESDGLMHPCCRHVYTLYIADEKDIIRLKMEKKKMDSRAVLIYRHGHKYLENIIYTAILKTQIQDMRLVQESIKRITSVVSQLMKCEGEILTLLRSPGF